jgi:hypothetical protein
VPLVSGVQAGSDLNHPTEIYYGAPAFQSANEMLANLGVTVFPEDKFNVFPDPALGVGSQLTIIRATPVVVNDAGHITTYRTWQKDIQGLLAENNIGLLGEDTADPAITTPITPDLTVTITRVAEVEVTETESIAYQTVKKNDPTMEKNQTRVEQQGQNGQKQNTYTVKRVNGVDVSKTLTSSTVVKQPVNKIVDVGTKIVVYASGKASYDSYQKPLTGSNNSIKPGTKVTVVNLNNGREVTVTIIGGGVGTSAVIDLSLDAFQALGGTIGMGILQNVQVDKYYPPLNI